MRSDIIIITVIVGLLGFILVSANIPPIPSDFVGDISIDGDLNVTGSGVFGVNLTVDNNLTSHNLDLSGTLSGIAGLNIISNPDVESGVGSPDDWFTGGGTWSTAQYRSPTHSLLLDPANENKDWRARFVLVSANEFYNFSCWHNGTVIAGEFFLTIRWFSNNDGTGYMSENNIAILNTATWNFISDVILSPSDALSADILFRTISGTGEVYADDFSITSGDTLHIGTTLDMQHNPIVNIDGTHEFTFSMVAGATDVKVSIIPPGLLTDDLHLHRFGFSVDAAPGVGKDCNVTLSDGSNTMFVDLVDAEWWGISLANHFDLDVSTEFLTLTYSQSAGGASTVGFVTYVYHTMVTP